MNDYLTKGAVIVIERLADAASFERPARHA